MELEVACCTEQVEDLDSQKVEEISPQNEEEFISNQEPIIESKLSEVLEAIVDEKVVESIDEHVRNENIFDDLILIETPKLDYSTLFSYLDSGIKENPYTEYKPEIVQEEKEIVKNLGEDMRYEEVADIMRDAGIRNILGLKQDLDKATKDRFEDYKMFNTGFNMVLYKMLS